MYLASDININCRRTYFLNHGISVHGDLQKIDYSIFSKNSINIDIVCAGFPCQPFSVAGKRLGIDDARGTIIYDIFKIVRELNPKMIVLENVKGLKSMENKKNDTEVKIYKWILMSLENMGYFYFDKIISPIEIGIPQDRERIIIVGVRNDLVQTKFQNNEEFLVDRIEFVKNLIKERNSINKNKKILEDKPKNSELSDTEIKTFKLWKYFLSMKEWDNIDNKNIQDLFFKKTGKKINTNFKQIHFFTDFLKYRDSNIIPPKLLSVYSRNKNQLSSSVKKKCDFLNKLYDTSEQFKNVIDKFLEEKSNLIMHKNIESHS